MRVIDISDPMNVALDFDISLECNGLLQMLKIHHFIGASDSEISECCLEDAKDVRRVLLELKSAGKIKLSED